MTLCISAAMKASSRASGVHQPLTPPEIGKFFVLFAISLPLYGAHACLCFLSSYEIYLCLSPFLFTTEELKIYVFIFILTIFLSDVSKKS